MKKLINFLIIATVSLAFACHKDATLTYLKPVSFTSVLNASTQEVVLTESTNETEELTLTWPAVVFPVKAQVTYSVQVDLPGDTTTATPWSNAKSVTIGKDILTKTFTGAELNTIAADLGVPPNTKGILVFRIQAYQDRNAFSKGVSVNVTTYKKIIISAGYPVLYVPGDYQGWSPGTAPTVAAPIANVYEGYINVPAGGTYQFKFTNSPDWDHINYGDSGTAGQLSTDGTKPGMTLPGAGYYELVANPSTLTWSYTLVTWGIIGDATPGGWDKDTKMTYDAAKQVWAVTADMVSTGSYKFRANSAWSIDFGIDANGKIQYADNPAFPYNGSLGNLTVPSSGNYTITLDLHDPNNYNYTLHKN